MDSVVAILSYRLKAYIDSRHGENISKAANYLDQEYTLIYRLYRGTQKSVTFFDAYEIFKRIAPEECRAIVREYFPREMLSLDNIRRDRDEDSMETLNKNLAAVFLDDLNTRIYVMTSESKQWTEEELAHELGNLGRRAVSGLIMAGVLKVCDQGEVVSNLKGYFSHSEINSKRLAQFNLKHIAMRNRGTAIINNFGYLNSEGVKKFYASLEKATEEQKAILEDESLKGDVLFLSSSFCGPLESNEDKDSSK